MQTAGGKAQHDITYDDIRPWQQARSFGDANSEAGQVVFAWCVEPGKLSRLATDQRAARLHASFSDAFDDLCGLIDVELAGGKVIQEEERLRSLAKNVVHAHRDQVD